MNQHANNDPSRPASSNASWLESAGRRWGNLSEKLDNTGIYYWYVGVFCAIGIALTLICVFSTPGTRPRGVAHWTMLGIGAIMGGIYGTFFVLITSIATASLATLLRISFPRHISDRFQHGVFAGLTGFIISAPCWWLPLTVPKQVGLCTSAIVLCYVSAFAIRRLNSSERTCSPMFLRWQFSMVELMLGTVWAAGLVLIGRWFSEQINAPLALGVYLLVQMTCITMDGLVFGRRWAGSAVPAEISTVDSSAKR